MAHSVLIPQLCWFWLLSTQAVLSIPQLLCEIGESGDLDLPDPDHSPGSGLQKCSERKGYQSPSGEGVLTGGEKQRIRARVRWQGIYYTWVQPQAQGQTPGKVRRVSTGDSGGTSQCRVSEPSWAERGINLGRGGSNDGRHEDLSSWSQVSSCQKREV